MDKVIIEEEKSSPLVILDPDKGEYKIIGRSFPENAMKFYRPVLDWLENLNSNGKIQPVNFIFELYYVSSSSVITILEVIKKLNALNEKGMDVSVKWYYDQDDDDLRKIGEDYAKMADVPFFIEPSKS